MVIKITGENVKFDENKIYVAIKKAMNDVDQIDDRIAKTIAHTIMRESLEYENITIYFIQNGVEKLLMEYRQYDTAKVYIKYRYEHDKDRKLNNELNEKISTILKCENITNDNANLDQSSFSGKENRVAEEINKLYARGMLRRNVLSAYDDNYIYMHDFSKLPIGFHNCLFADVGKLLQNGFKTRNGDVRPARSIRSAMQNVAVIFQIQSQF